MDDIVEKMKEPQNELPNMRINRMRIIRMDLEIHELVARVKNLEERIAELESNKKIERIEEYFERINKYFVLLSDYDKNTHLRIKESEERIKELEGRDIKQEERIRHLYFKNKEEYKDE